MLFPYKFTYLIIIIQIIIQIINHSANLRIWIISFKFSFFPSFSKLSHHIRWFFPTNLRIWIRIIQVLRSAQRSDVHEVACASAHLRRELRAQFGVPLGAVLQQELHGVFTAGQRGLQ